MEVKFLKMWFVRPLGVIQNVSVYLQRINYSAIFLWVTKISRNVSDSALSVSFIIDVFNVTCVTEWMDK